jgi:hypothetical protein
MSTTSSTEHIYQSLKRSLESDFQPMKRLTFIDLTVTEGEDEDEDKDEDKDEDEDEDKDKDKDKDAPSDIDDISDTDDTIDTSNIQEIKETPKKHEARKRRNQGKYTLQPYQLSVNRMSCIPNIIP